MSVSPVTIVGNFLSPYVRKVLVCLQIKGVPYRIDPIVPFYGNDDFSKLSPLRRIPVLIDEGARGVQPGDEGPLVLTDSTVICEYLDERYPDPALLPRDPAARARARWLEEYSDSRMGDVFIWQLFNQVAIGPFVWGRPPDPAKLQRTLNQEIPAVMDYLETQVPASGFLFDALSLADIALCCPFRNAAIARFKPDATRWPKTAAYVARVLSQPAFAALKPFEDLCCRTPLPQHREALLAAGAPVTSTTYATATPRRGIMRIDDEPSPSGAAAT